MFDNIVNTAKNIIGGVVGSVEHLFNGNQPQQAPPPQARPVQQAPQPQTPQGPSLGDLATALSQVQQTQQAQQQQNQQRQRQLITQFTPNPTGPGPQGQVTAGNGFNAAGDLAYDGAQQIVNAATPQALIAKGNYDAARYAVAAATGNKQAQANAAADFQGDYAPTVQMGQGIARDIGGLGVQLTGQPNIQAGQTTNSTVNKLQNIIFGTNENIPSLGQRVNTATGGQVSGPMASVLGAGLLASELGKGGKVGDLTDDEKAAVGDVTRPPVKGAPQRPNAVVANAISKGGVLNKLGPYGQQLAQLFAKQFGDRQIYTQHLLDNLKPFFSLSKADAEIVRNAVQSNDPEVYNNLTDTQKAGVDAIRQTMPRVYQRGTDAGRNIGDQGSTYFPRVTDWSKVKFGTKTYNDIIDHLVKTGQASDDTEAVAKLEEQRNRDMGLVQPGFSNFKTRELEFPHAQVSAKQALDYYVRGAAHNITQAENFGANSEKLHELIAGVKSTGHDAGLARQITDRILHPPKPSGLGAQVRGVFGLTRLSKAAVAHATQLINPGSLVGYGRTAGALVKSVFSPKDWKWAQSTGVNSELSEIRKAGGFEGVAGKLTAPGLNAVMKFNRTVTAVAGRNAARAWMKAGRRDLVERILGVSPKGDVLTPEEEVQAGRALVQKTMFNHNPLDTPLWAETEGGRFVGQYRMQYGYKQTGFIYNSVINEARNGNLAPLARFVLGVPLAGAAVVGIKSAITGNKPDLSPTNVASQGGGGLPADLVSQGPYFKTNPAGTAAGTVAPVAGEAVNIAQDTNRAIQGNPKSLERYGLRLVPVVGNRLANKVVPPAPQSAINYAQTATAAQKQFLSNKGDLDQWKALHPGAGGTPIDTVAHYSIYQSNPKVFQADKYIALHNPDTAPAGKHAAIFDLTPQQANDVFNIEKIKNALPGSTSQFSKTDADYIKNVESSAWYQKYSQDNGKYYQNLAAQGVVTKAKANAYTPPTAQQQTLLNQMNGLTGSAMTQLIDSNPALQQYLSTHADEANIQRADLGLPPLPKFPEPPNPKVSAEAVAYSKLPQGTGARSAFLKSHPDYYAYWQQEQAYYAQAGSTSSTSSSGKSSGSSGSLYIRLDAPKPKPLRFEVQSPRPVTPLKARFTVPHTRPVRRATMPQNTRFKGVTNTGVKSSSERIRST